MTQLLKMTPLLLGWWVIGAAMARRFTNCSRHAAAGSAIGYCCGVFGWAALLMSLRGDLPYNIVKFVTGGIFILFWVMSVMLLYRATGSSRQTAVVSAVRRSLMGVYFVSISTGTIAGAISVCRLLPQGGEISFIPLIIITASALCFTIAAVAGERFIPESITLTNASFASVVFAILLFISSFTPRLDLFSPLTMKVMKFIHDFIHQLFESMLIPDHPFFRSDVWSYIGYMFSSGVGFWGGMIIWFLPVLLVIISIRVEPLPSVVNIRQGAQRRKLVASYIHQRRCRLIAPSIAVFIFAAAVYQSRFPDIEYWNPTPVEVGINRSGQIVIPKKGEIDLEDGKLHKYICKQDGREARFLILMNADGRLTATLDACAICKPDGYGQADGSVICFYCKTLIPLDTVGKPGGCNPVPIPFKAGSDAVSIDVATLFNIWSDTVTQSVRVEGGRN